MTKTQIKIVAMRVPQCAPPPLAPPLPREPEARAREQERRKELFALALARCEHSEHYARLLVEHVRGTPGSPALAKLDIVLHRVVPWLALECPRGDYDLVDGVLGDYTEQRDIEVVGQILAKRGWHYAEVRDRAYVPAWYLDINNWGQAQEEIAWIESRGWSIDYHDEVLAIALHAKPQERVGR